jgi:hypothetical protein
MELNVVDPIVIGVTIPVAPAVGINTSQGNIVTIVPWPGALGPQGPPGNNAPVIGETPSGTQNGTNEVFTLVHSYAADSTAVYRNGLREVLNVGYTESGAGQITFTTPPLSSDVLTVDYLVQ